MNFLINLEFPHVSDIDRAFTMTAPYMVTGAEFGNTDPITYSSWLKTKTIYHTHFWLLFGSHKSYLGIDHYIFRH